MILFLKKRKPKQRRKLPEKFEKFILSASSIEEIAPAEKNDFKVKILYVILDTITTEMRARFSENDTILRSIDCFHPTSADFANYSNIEPFAIHYGADLETLQAELKLIPKTVKLYETEKNIKVTSVLKFLNFLEFYKHAFWESYKLCVISVTIPVSSSACERTFSCLRLIKSYLRSTMLDKRLSNLAVLYIEKVLAKNLNLDLLIERFATRHNHHRLILY